MSKNFDKILNTEFIIKNEFELDEIIRIYGTTGDIVKAHINQIENIDIKIIRKYTMIENSGTEIVSEDEYNKNFLSDKSYYKIEYGDSIDYLKDNYDEFEISKEDYDNEIKHKLTSNHFFTSLNYSEFINDFDFENFNSFFEQIVINKISIEFLKDVENYVISKNKIKGKILLQKCLSDLIISNKFLEDFKNSDDSNKIQKEICSHFLYYNYIIKISFINYYELIFPKLINYFSTIETSKTNKLLNDLLDACYKTQDTKIFHDNKDENIRTKQILDLLGSKNEYITESQLPTGKSSTGKNIGSCDGVIFDKKSNEEYYVEALNLDSFDKKYLETHVNKLELNYDFKGLPVKFVLVYCNLKENKFENFVANYKNFIENELTFHYEKTKIEEEIPKFKKFAESRIFYSTHIRENKNVHLYHILLKFSEKP